MNFSICKFKPKSSLHLGEREGFREGTEIFIHSDTIFSAFCHCFLLLYGKQQLEELLEQFDKNNPPFIISSAFPYWNDRLYFPIPENQLPKDKKLKKKKFVEKSSFEKLLAGELLEEIKENKFIPDEEPEAPYLTIDVPRIGLSRLTNHPGENYFHFGEVFYEKNAGLFFLYELKEKQLEKQFHATIRLIADEGIGGDRSTGKGLLYQPEFSTVEIILPENTSSVVILSLYSPQEKELTDITEAYYQVITRKGYIYSPYCQSLRRKSIRMFTEGSVFANKIVGKMVNITPEIFTAHKIYRYGFAFTLPCSLKD